MGILVCIDEFTYDVVADLHPEGAERQAIGYDDSCEWEKIIVEDVSGPGKPVPFRVRL